MASPLSYQVESIKRHADILARADATLEASIPGFGKTYVAGFLAAYLKRRVAVVCPKSVRPSWERAMRECGAGVVFITNYEQTKLAKFSFGRWQVKGRVYEWKVPTDTLIVFDEAHRCADRTTQNAKLMIAAARQKIKTLVMSATIAQSPLEMYALGLLLGLHKGGDFFGWCFRHGVFKGRFAFEFDGTPASLRKLNTLVFPAHGYRASFADIPDFPSEKVETLGVDVANPSQVDELWAKIQELELLKADATEPITLRLRARQQSELLKVPAFTELIKDSVAEGQSVCVFVNFIATLEQLAAAFPKAEIIRGGQTAEARQIGVDNFQADKSRVMIAQSQAGGVGISLHDLHGNFPRRSLISPPESARSLIQILGRIRRTGGKSLALQTLVFAQNTVEVKVQRAVERRKGQIEMINDGDLDPNT
jgi:superfamily II DNA or RNA helicase